MSHVSAAFQALPQRRKKALEQTPLASQTAFTWAAAAARHDDETLPVRDLIGLGLDDKSAGQNSMWKHPNKIGLFPIWITYPDGDCILMAAVGSRCIFNMKCEESSLATKWKGWKHFDWTVSAAFHGCWCKYCTAQPHSPSMKKMFHSLVQTHRILVA